MIGYQCLMRLEHMHSRNFIHRDIKPDNFLIGCGKREDVIHIIDFGLAKRYRNPITGTHITFKKNKGQMGTLRFSSINATKANEQSRRDDLEALGYMLAYFLNGGRLPWSGFADKELEDCSPMRNKGAFRRVRDIKEQTTPEELFPPWVCQEFSHYLHYCRMMPFEALPDYEFLKNLFL